ncbi:UNVERIFIED_ORG: hypothetical protein ABIB52_001911 [Arthrobacter sp. UYCu721]
MTAPSRPKPTSAWRMAGPDPIMVYSVTGPFVPGSGFREPVRAITRSTTSCGNTRVKTPIET